MSLLITPILLPNHSSSSYPGLYPITILACPPWASSYNCRPVHQQIAQQIATLPPALACVLTLLAGLLLLSLFPEAHLLRKSHHRETLQRVVFSAIILLLGILLLVVSLVVLLPQALLSLPFPLIVSPFLLYFYSTVIILLWKGLIRLYQSTTKEGKQSNYFLHFVWFTYLLIIWSSLVLYLTSL